MLPANRWFGDPWPSDELRAPVCEDDSIRVDTPVGSQCLLCQELIKKGDRGTITFTSSTTHIECQMRAVLGNHLHVRGECSYTGECNEKSTLSFREEALEVWAWTQQHGIGKANIS